VRLVAFSDGVFAITITLLVLEIRPPTDDRNLVHGLVALWPIIGSSCSRVLSGHRSVRGRPSCSRGTAFRASCVARRDGTSSR
jgi:hypothetical protein